MTYIKEAMAREGLAPCVNSTQVEGMVHTRNCQEAVEPAVGKK